jgi:hypothetical protein
MMPKPDTKSILHLITTVPPHSAKMMASVERTYDEGKKALAEIGMDLDALLTELVGLRGRCLCKGAFRCTPCLEEMEADGTHRADVDAARTGMLLALELLRLLPATTPLTCHQCGGSSGEPEFCGCGGKQTAGEAIRWYESQLEILSK